MNYQYESSEEYGEPWQHAWNQYSNSQNNIMEPHLAEVEALLVADPDFPALKKIVSGYISRNYCGPKSHRAAQLEAGTTPVKCMEATQWNVKSQSSQNMTRLQRTILHRCGIPIYVPTHSGAFRGTRIWWHKWAVMKAIENGLDVPAEVRASFDLK